MTTVEYGLVEEFDDEYGNLTFTVVGEGEGSNYAFDSTAVQISLWIAYSIVFCLCFFGKGF